MKLKPYPNYKPSGIEWLGDVPQHWEASRLDYVASVKGRLGWKGLTASEYVGHGYIFLSTPNIKGGGAIDFDNVNHITAQRYYESPEIMLKEGDVLVAKDGSTLGITNFVRELPRPATVNSSIAVIRPSGIESSFLYRWLSACYMQAVIQSMKDGQGVPHLFQADIKKFKVLLPLLPEQRAIADFLDLRTAKLDALLDKKRALIEKLKEKRSALISRTVTRGLPAEAAAKAGLPTNPTFKPSGIEWIGEIPEHWRINAIKNIVSTPVTDGPHETPEILTDGIPFVSAEAIRNRRIDFGRIRGYISEEDHRRFSKKYSPRAGDIYMVKSGATTGRIAMVEDDRAFNIWSPLAAIRCDPTVARRRFIFYSLHSKEFQTEVELSWSFGTQQNLGMGVIQNLPVPLPPLPEQRAIAAYLDAETAQIERLIEKVEAAIEKLAEYRSALINAAVTGKIDVRDVAV